MSVTTAIPVLYYHSVADHSSPGPWSFLSCPIPVFKRQMGWLAAQGWHTCTSDEMSAHLAGEKALPEKSVLIQFDDGFLDNWSVVFPLMERLKLKYTVLLSPDFIADGPVRPFVETTRAENRADWWGYLRTGEIRRMRDSGLVDFQAHGYTHTWYESSDEIIDVYDGTQTVPWLFWNRHPERKPEWLSIDMQKNIEFGRPLFRHEKSLSLRKRFIPDERFIAEAIARYDARIPKEGNLDMIVRLAERYRRDGLLGTWETEEMAEKRWEQELAGAKKRLEEIVERPIRHLVWPGGGTGPEIAQRAYDTGYSMLSKGSRPNSFGSGSREIWRMSGYHRFAFPLLDPFLNLILLRLQLARGRGNRLINSVFQIMKPHKV